jgi:hypothetical protein
VTSISEITRLIASIEEWKHEHGNLATNVTVAFALIATA